MLLRLGRGGQRDPSWRQARGCLTSRLATCGGDLGQRLGVRASVSHLYEAEGVGASGVLSPGRYMVPAHQGGPGQDPSPGFWLPRARLHGRSPGAYWADAGPWAVECGFLLSHWTPPTLPRQTCPLGGPHAL